ncbi:MAG: endopeptidase La [Chloroflexi bacterium]|nr:endopeptidase La [Chloroflexota bacterium]
MFSQEAIEEAEKAQHHERERAHVPAELPILPLRNTVVYPNTVLPLVVQRPRSVRLVDDAVIADRRVALVGMPNPNIEDPRPGDVYTIGTMALIHRLVRAPDDTLHIIVQGLERVEITEFTQTDPYLRGKVEARPETVEESVEVEALVRHIGALFEKLVGLAPYIPDAVVTNVLNTDDPLQLAYMVATSTRMDVPTRQRILELDSVAEKLRTLVGVLTREVDVLELGKKIQKDAQSGIEQVQREYFLREQLKAIRRELGEEDEQTAEVNELRAKIEAAGMPEEAKKEALRELDRMANLPTAAAEYSVIRTYLTWLVELPWQVVTPDKLDIKEARRVLDEDHYDLEKIKDRIIEYLAVRRLRQERRRRPAKTAFVAAEGTADGNGEHPEGEESVENYLRPEREGAILCFVGPPGVGKTSLGRSIARAMGRKFIRQSLGGVHDEAEIRGHRRTYIGAMPGRIIQAIRRVGSRNPVFMLDEVDKIGSDFRGDPSSALLEVLDPEQNREFRDNYLDVPFDLSQVMFITTANVLDTIPAPLRDRMEILQLSGYTEQEKVAIAEGYLVPRQIRENGLLPEEISFEREALRRIIRDYTREAGVRELERQIGTICRKVAAQVAAELAPDQEGTQPQGTTVITADTVADYLGRPIYFYEVAERTQVPGVATGLAWTPTGGDILFIEATKMRGNKGFILTGQLGEVMRESAQAALSYVRSKARDLGIDEEEFEKVDIHLHIPAGAIPKDGPSAGVAMATALASLMKGVPVNSKLGMTGEITLRGQVLPVGGIKEKVLAAHRAGLEIVCLPKCNEKDLDDIPEDVRNRMTFILVDRVEQVFDAAFGSSEGSIRVKRKKKQQNRVQEPG